MESKNTDDLLIQTLLESGFDAMFALSLDASRKLIRCWGATKVEQLDGLYNAWQSGDLTNQMYLDASSAVYKYHQVEDALINIQGGDNSHGDSQLL